MGGLYFVVAVNRPTLASAQWTPAWLSRCLGANQGVFKFLGEPFFGNWYAIRLANDNVVQVWTSLKLASGADLRLLAVRSDGQLARLELSCGTVFVRVVDMVEALDLSLEGDLSVFDCSADVERNPASTTVACHLSVASVPCNK
jgi:hypothetical protein